MKGFEKTANRFGSMLSAAFRILTIPSTSFCFCILSFSLSATLARARGSSAADQPAAAATKQAASASSAGIANGSVWDHLRFSLDSANFSHDPSGYTGPRSFYVLTSWTTNRGTLLRFRVYADNYLPREVNGITVNPKLTSANIQNSIKEIYVQHKFTKSFTFTAGDIRATAHSDNNKRLYSGDGHPMHSDITEIDRVLGVSVAFDRSWGRMEFTLADRGRRDLRWDGLMETVRLSRSSADKLKEAQVTFVNRNGDDALGVAAPHQWQAGAGGSIAGANRMNKLSAEYVHGNFLPQRSGSTDAIGVAFERKLMKNGALVAVVDYEYINGPTGVNFFEAGASALIFKIDGNSWLRLDAGYRHLDPTEPAKSVQHGPFVRVGIVYDRGKGSTPMPPRIIG